MGDLMQTPQHGPQTMTSREIAEVVESRHDKVKQSIERLVARGVIVQPPMGDEHSTDKLGRPRKEEVYHVGKRDSFVVVAQLSPEFTARLVDRWQELENGSTPMRLATQAEQMLAMAQFAVDIERKTDQLEQTQGEHTRAIVVLNERVDAGMTVLKTRPANSESITHLRDRIGDTFGLSASIVNQAMQAPDAPRPAGMVESQHADGQPFAVFWKRDVTRFFERFVKDCKPATPFMCTHPYIEGRFRTPAKSELI